jgi:hypothetical protein
MSTKLRKPKTDPTQPLIGTYPLGDTYVDLYAVTDSQEAALFFKPEAGALPRIKIGLDDPDWRNVVDSLLHESMEFLMMQNNVTFDAVGSSPFNTQNRYFLFNHGQFCDLIHYQSEFLIAAQPALEKVWKKHKPRS